MASTVSDIFQIITIGEVVVKVFPGGQPEKGERELLEGMQVGTIDMAVTAESALFVEFANRRCRKIGFA